MIPCFRMIFNYFSYHCFMRSSSNFLWTCVCQGKICFSMRGLVHFFISAVLSWDTKKKKKKNLELTRLNVWNKISLLQLFSGNARFKGKKYLKFFYSMLISKRPEHHAGAAFTSFLWRGYRNRKITKSHFFKWYSF